MKTKIRRSLPLALAALALAGVITSIATADAAAPAGRYVIGSDASVATVLDKKTKLTWERSFEAASPFASSHCDDLNQTLGEIGWRLPTAKELFTLVDYGVDPGLALIDTTFFPNTPLEPFGSSTPTMPDPGFVCVDFGSGLDECGVSINIRCVR